MGQQRKLRGRGQPSLTLKLSNNGAWSVTSGEKSRRDTWLLHSRTTVKVKGTTVQVGQAGGGWVQQPLKGDFRCQCLRLKSLTKHQYENRLDFLTLYTTLLSEMVLRQTFDDFNVKSSKTPLLDLKDTHNAFCLQTVLPRKLLGVP